MENVLKLSTQPKVFNAAYLVRLSEANRAVKALHDVAAEVDKQMGFGVYGPEVE